MRAFNMTGLAAVLLLAIGSTSTAGAISSLNRVIHDRHAPSVIEAVNDYYGLSRHCDDGRFSLRRPYDCHALKRQIYRHRHNPCRDAWYEDCYTDRHQWRPRHASPCNNGRFNRGRPVDCEAERRRRWYEDG